MQTIDDDDVGDDNDKGASSCTRGAKSLLRRERERGKFDFASAGQAK